MVLQKAKEKPLFVQSLERIADGPLFLEAGGQLIRDVQGEIMGAIGVTGDVNEMDNICAIGGISAAGLRADDHLGEKNQRRLSIKRNPKLKDPRKKSS
jgi:uncharacterized protein GlcG (DUF336 family)